MMSRPSLAAAIVLASGLACWGLYVGSRGDRASPPTAAASTMVPRTPPRSQPAGADWRSLRETCDGSQDPETLRTQLAGLKEKWLEDDLHTVAQTAARLLRSGEDAATGMSLEVGPGGSLRGWPTMRVFLLDLLAIADPDLAVEIAREVLAGTRSAEEYALALKPLLMEGPWRASEEELQAHFSKLLWTRDWQTREGFAEALDLARVVSSPGTAEILARWMDASPPALEAGEMALHETAAKAPRLFVELISGDRTLFADQPDLRAGLMARATVSEEGQAAGIESYLKNPAIPAAEKETFLKLYPLRSATSGHRLYGTLPKPFERGQVAADDRAALEAVTRWKTDPSLVPLLPSITALEGRLQTWVKQAED